MRVLFIYTCDRRDVSERPIYGMTGISLAVSLLSSFLKSRGHVTDLAVLARRTPFSVVDDCIARFKPDVLAFSAVSTEISFVTRIAEYTKERYPSIPRIIGGVHVTLHPEEKMLEHFDALCVGEGEYPLLEWIEQLEAGHNPTDIRNLWLKTPEGIVEKNPPRTFLQNLDALPYVDRRMWEPWITQSDKPYWPSVLLGRGCPFLCTYCSNHALKKLAEGEYVRFRGPANIVGEIEEIVTTYPDVKDIYLEVETLTANLDWAFSLIQALKEFNSRRESPITFSANVRVTPGFTRHAEAFFRALREAGFRSVNMGLESGSEQVRTKTLNRHYDNQDIIAAVEAARGYGLDVVFFILIGLPGETPADYFQTVEMSRTCMPKTHYISIFAPYPGTRLFELCRERNLLPRKSDSKRERIGATMDYPEFTRDQIQKAFIWFLYYILYGIRDKNTLVRVTFRRYLLVYDTPLKRALIPYYMARDVFSPQLRLKDSAGEKDIFISLIMRYIRHMLCFWQ